MKWKSFTLILLSLAAGYYSGASPVRKQSRKPPCLIENNGQVVSQSGTSRADIDFKIQAGGGLNIFLGNSQLHYQWNRHDKGSAIQMYRMDVTLIGANPNPQIIRQEPVGYHERHYLPSIGSTGVLAKSFGKVTYKDIYPGIDWVLYFNQGGQLEHDFVVHPNGKVTDIKLRYEGATSLRVDRQGQLIANTPYGSVTEHAPFAYQQADGLAIASKFELRDNELSFAIERFEGTLVIDPTIEWATYYGDFEKDHGTCVATDTDGNVFIAGITESTENIATTGAFQTTYGGATGETGTLGDAFIAKFNEDGDLTWATYYGGSNDDAGTGIRIDPDNNLYLCGWTRSSDVIATTGSFQESYGGGDDAFLVKFDGDGERLWATYYGGEGDENNATNGSLYVDEAASIYFAGRTSSSGGMATEDAYQPDFGGSERDGFLVKFDTDGARLWATYFGGEANDAAHGISGVGDSVIFLVGSTSSEGMASVDAYQEAFGGTSDGFIARFSSEGALSWATYFGGSLTDAIYGALATEDHLYIAGITNSSSGIATSGSHQETLGGSQDALLAQFDHDGSINWATYYGGTVSDGLANATTLAADLLGNIYFAGQSSSLSGIASEDAIQTDHAGSWDGFVAKFDVDGVRDWATYYGGSGADYAAGVATNGEGIVYVVGRTTSGSGITSDDSWQEDLGGGNDAFLLAINDCMVTSSPGEITGSTSVCAHSEQTYSIDAVDGAVSYSWTAPDGWLITSEGTDAIIIVGESSGDISVVANGLCSSSEPSLVSVTISPKPTLTPGNDTVVCEGDVIILEALIAGEDIAYLWQRDEATIPGESGQLLSVAAAGAYRVITDNGICADTSNSIEIGVNPLPTPVIINTDGILSTTDPYSTYQWNFDGTPIVGATSPTFAVTIEGEYSVTVTDENGCSGTSSHITDLDGIVAQTQFSIYPNPTSGHASIQSLFEGFADLTGTDGRVVQSRLEFNPGTTQFDVSSLANGVYWLNVRSQKGELSFHRKLVISQ